MTHIVTALAAALAFAGMDFIISSAFAQLAFARGAKAD